MDSTNSGDWQTWLLAIQVDFASILKANVSRKYQPRNQKFTDICQFPLGDDKVAIKILHGFFKEEGSFVISAVATDDQSNTWMQCTTTLDKFLRCVSQEQVSVFLHKYGHLARDQMLDTTELEFPTDVDLDADLGSWVDLLHLPDILDWYDNDWLLVDTAEL
ncbi:hypothetical protein MMC22_007135 [Lobaria immixta]|nr:hypothetical protein [Lobaria immixta]